MDHFHFKMWHEKLKKRKITLSSFPPLFSFLCAYILAGGGLGGEDQEDDDDGDDRTAFHYAFSHSHTHLNLIHFK